MNLRVRCSTFFDITATGVKNRFYKARIPFTDNIGQSVTDDETWFRSRNQQSNWETINQIISLRTLPENISIPVCDKKSQQWSFEFDVVDPNSIASAEGPLGYLLGDCNNVPMILGLDEKPGLSAYLVSLGNEPNVIFKLVNNE
jgi:hypothetical protein